MNGHRRWNVVLAAMLVAMGTSGARAGAEWPQFRGPDGQGHGVGQGLPATWSETENVAWKTPVPGRGWSSPVVAGNDVWLTTASRNGVSLRVIQIDRQSGKLTRNAEVFRPSSPPPINEKNSYASPTPIVEGERLYVHFGALGTACLSTASLEVLWKNDELAVDHKEGPGSSPALVGDLLIIPCDGIDRQYVAALNKIDGKLAWRSDRPGPLNPNPDFRKAYSTPLAINVDGRTLVICPGADQAIAYDPANGKEIWKLRYKGFSNVPRPIFGNGLLYVCTGYMAPQLWAVRPDGEGDITENNVVWRCKEQAPANPSPILVGDALYMVSDRGILSCLNAKTGAPRWKGRLEGNYTASPVYADGRLFFFNEDGKGTVVKPGVKLEIEAVNKLPGRILASPAIAGRSLFVRTDSALYRLEDRAAAASR